MLGLQKAGDRVVTKGPQGMEQPRGGGAVTSGRARCRRGVGISCGGEMAGECAALGVGFGSSTTLWKLYRALELAVNVRDSGLGLGPASRNRRETIRGPRQ